MDQSRFAGDLGKSLITRRDVTPELFERIPATAYLGDHWYNPINVYRHSSLNFGRTKRKTYVENATQILALAGIFIPEFWFAIIAVLLFLLHLGWLPSSGYTSPYLFDLACDRDRLPASRQYNSADPVQHAKRNEHGIRRHRAVPRLSRAKGRL